VSLDELQEKIQELEDYVQSTDVAAMQSAFRTPASSLYIGRSSRIPRRAVMCCLLRILFSVILKLRKRRLHIQLGLYRKSSVGVLAHVLYYAILCCAVHIATRRFPSSPCLHKVVGAMGLALFAAYSRGLNERRHAVKDAPSLFCPFISAVNSLDVSF